MTDAFRDSRLEAMAALYASATSVQHTTWRVLSPGMFLAEIATTWPFECSAKDRLSLAAIFNTGLAARGLLL